MPSSQTPENLAEDRGLSFRQALLKYPGETPEVDYKNGIKFNAGDDFSLKIAKHILGMANNGGGYIILGYPENSAKHPEATPNLSDEVVASYDPSILASFIEKYATGSEKISLAIHKDKHPDSGTTYPIIEVHGFKSRPFFCKSSAHDILQEGALYIRIASARTVRIASPDNWDQLIGLCVEKRQDDLLKRFRALLKEVGMKSSEVSLQTEDDSIKQWNIKNRGELKEIINKNALDSMAFLETTHYLTSPSKNWNAGELLEAAQKSALRKTGWPIGFVAYNEFRPKPMSDGIKTVFADTETVDFWYLKNDGSYYFGRSYEENHADKRTRRYPPLEGPVLFFDTRIWRIAEVFLHCAALYRHLGVDPSTKIRISINHYGIASRKLEASDSNRIMSWSRSAAVDESTWEREVSLDFLTSGISDLTKEVSRNLFELFDFWKPEENVLDSVIEEFMRSRMYN